MNEFPEISRIEHYHDTGEHAINRSLQTYKKMVFEENIKFWLRKKPENMQPSDPEQWSLRHYHSLEHYVPRKIADKTTSQKDESIQYEWDWKENKIFGGFENFFAPNSIILDLGSGKARALREINEQFQTENIRCFGVDYRYAKEIQEDSKNLVAADFEALPFRDNSFDRILSVESFPAWLPKEEKIIDQYIEEITRVSRQNSIWRGTLPMYYDEDEIIFSADLLTKKIVENGWEVITNGNYFVAKLITSKN